MKKTILAMALNLLFGGVGYLYIRERKPLAIALTLVTAYEFIRNVLVMSDPATLSDPYAIHPLPMLSLFGSVPGVITLIIITVDIYFLVRRQDKKTGDVWPTEQTKARAGAAKL